jgi:hypothetical protein
MAIENNIGSWPLTHWNYLQLSSPYFLAILFDMDANIN